MSSGAGKEATAANVSDKRKTAEGTADESSVKRCKAADDETNEPERPLPSAAFIVTEEFTNTFPEIDEVESGKVTHMAACNKEQGKAPYIAKDEARKKDDEKRLVAHRKKQQGSGVDAEEILVLVSTHQHKGAGGDTDPESIEVIEEAQQAVQVIEDAHGSLGDNPDMEVIEGAQGSGGEDTS